jgi:hypothetical protein
MESHPSDMLAIVACVYMGLSESSQNRLMKTIMSYLDPILHHHLQSLLGSTHTDPSVSATFEMHPGSVLLGCLVLRWMLRRVALVRTEIPSISSQHVSVASCS